jgi:hypothetical protein
MDCVFGQSRLFLVFMYMLYAYCWGGLIELNHVLLKFHYYMQIFMQF